MQIKLIFLERTIILQLFYNSSPFLILPSSTMKYNNINKFPKSPYIPKYLSLSKLLYALTPSKYHGYPQIHVYVFSFNSKKNPIKERER